MTYYPPFKSNRCDLPQISDVAHRHFATTADHWPMPADVADQVEADMQAVYAQLAARREAELRRSGVTFCEREE